jgi:hypothetical protein
LFTWEDTQRLFIFTGNLAHDLFSPDEAFVFPGEAFLLEAVFSDFAWGGATR